MTTSLLQVRVLSVRYEAEDINSYELVDPDGGDLPHFTAGAHIDVHLGEGRIRQYSLCNAPIERHRYVIGVLLERGGRGGSIAIHEHVRPGRILAISPPRNLFPVATGARRHLLLAGGIGVTPMMAMLEHLEREYADYALHYCTRGPERTAFRHRLAPAVAAGRVHIHHDGGNPRDGLDIAALLLEQLPGTHLYYCGPPGFMTAARNTSAHWAGDTVHCEYFTPMEREPAATVGPRLDDAASPPEFATPSGATGLTTGFQVGIRSRGAVYDVPADKSIVQVLREHGMEVETSCESGLCGTCRTRYVEGDPEHNDYVLDDDEQSEYVMICCARSKSPLLVLDL